MEMHPAFKRIRKILGREVHRQLVLRCLAMFIFLIAVQAVLLSITGFLYVRYPLSRLILEMSAAVCCIHLFIAVYAVVLFLERRRVAESVARTLDHLNPAVQEAFQTSFSLNNHSPATLDALGRLYAPQLEFLKKPAWPAVLQRAVSALAIAAGLWIAAGFLSSDFRKYVRSSFAPLSALKDIPVLHIRLAAENVNIGKGDSLRLYGRLIQFDPGQQIYAYMREGENESRFPLNISDSAAIFTTGPLHEDVSVFFGAANGRSNVVEVSVLERPYIAFIRAVVSYPAYMKIQDDSLPPGTTSFSAYPGTRIRWNVSASRSLSSLAWEFRGLISGGDSLRQADSLGPGTDYTIEKNLFNVEALKIKPADAGSPMPLPVSYEIALRDTYGIQGRFPVHSLIEMKADEPPRVSIIAPVENARVSRNEKLELFVLARDDFQLRRLTLTYRLSSGGILKDSARLDVTDWLPEKGKGHFRKIWDLGFLDMRPDNVLIFSFLACDNDVINGPKCAESELRTVRFPGIQELIAEAGEKESDARSFLRSASERQKNVAEMMQRVKEKRAPEPLELSAYQLRQIMVTDPLRHQAEGKRLLDRVKKGRDKSRADFKNYEKALKHFEKAIPEGGIEQQTVREQLKELGQLAEEELKFKRECEGVLEQDRKEKQLEPGVRQELEQLEQELKQNLDSQKELEAYLKEGLDEQDHKKALENQVLKEQGQVLDDLKKSIEALESFVDKSREEGVFSDQLLEKLERVRELMKEAIPDSLMEMLRMKMEGEKVNAEALSESLQQLMNNRESFEQSIDRALAMLENARDMKKLDEWKQRMSELREKQESLAGQIPQAGEKGGVQREVLEKSQQALNQEAQRLLDEVRAASEKKPDLRRLQQEMAGNKLPQTMQQITGNLAEPGSEARSRAASAAQSASLKMKSMVQSLEKFLAGMNAPSFSLDIGAIERLLYESLQLSMLQETLGKSRAEREKLGWHSPPAAIYGQCHQVARWLSQELRKMSSENPFVGSVLLTQARELESALRKASSEQDSESAEKALQHNHNVSRELLKLFRLARSMSMNGGQGGGSGQPGASGGGGGSPEDLSRQLQGISGEQFAVNQATSRLLQAMLENRRPGGSGTNPQGATPQGLANTQGALGEKLEQMAESADEQGQASRKLRQLAEEARTLETQMRKGMLAPELEEHQARFRSRLLDASKALKERGYSSSRQGVRDSSGVRENAGAVPYHSPLWLELLEDEKKRAEKLPLNSFYRQALEQYFESLLTR